MGSFTDRDEILSAFERFVGSDRQIFMLWGVAGMGKSRLISELATRVPDGRGFIIDLSSVIATDHIDRPQGPAGELLAQIAGAMAGWAQSHRLERQYTEAASKAVDLLRSSDVQILLQAKGHSAITGNQTQVIAGPSPEAFTAYRRQLVSALVDVARQVTHPGMLLIDTSELLFLLDDVARERISHQPPLSHWFTHAVLLRLTSCNPHIKLVIAGRDKPPQSLGIEAEVFELTHWESAHTVEFLRSCGITDQALVAEAHRLCHGMPMWLALLAEWNGELERQGTALTPELLRREAAGRPVENWLTETFLERLSPAQEKALRAAVVPRQLTEELLSELVSGDDLPHDWFSRFRRHSFVQSTNGKLQIHALIRQAVLSELEQRAPRQLIRLHRMAAEYFNEIGQPLEEAYHRFAIGDTRQAEWWATQTEKAILSQDSGTAQLHLALVAEQDTRLAAIGMDQLLARAAYLAGRLAFSRTRWEEATRFFEDAKNRFEGLGDKKGVADTLLAILTAASTHGDRRTVAENAQIALDLYRQLGLPAGESDALSSMAWDHIRSGDFDRAGVLAAAAERAAIDAGAAHLRAEAVRALSWAQRLGGDLDNAESSARRALELYKSNHNPRGQVNAMVALQEVLLERKAFRAAEPIAHEHLMLAERIGYEDGQVTALFMRAAITHGKGLPELAVTQASEALTLATETGIPLWQGRSLMVRAKALADLGRLNEATRDADHARSVFDRVPDQSGATAATRFLGKIAEMRANTTSE
ncbi:hypothetical protein [Nocardia sp. NPDC052566]|uniref:hypothetical protein n=1 Tax=Nocardia sp. NPDC052566 TaxID=3364330 RepID=UPI0037C55FC9